MKERPIIFSASMVLAILEGRKTQTRRVVKRRGDGELPLDFYDGMFWYADGDAHEQACPYGKPGDRLWVRETFVPWRRTSYEYDEWEGGKEALYHLTLAQFAAEYGKNALEFNYRATTPEGAPDSGWFPAIHMPRWASRITLEITGVRVQRLQDISCLDLMEEGSPVRFREYSDGSHGCVAATNWFRHLWNELNGPKGFGWDANPWVWAISFRRVGGAA